MMYEYAYKHSNSQCSAVTMECKEQYTHSTTYTTVQRHIIAHVCQEDKRYTVDAYKLHIHVQQTTTLMIYTLYMYVYILYSCKTLIGVQKRCIHMAVNKCTPNKGLVTSICWPTPLSSTAYPMRSPTPLW